MLLTTTVGRKNEGNIGFVDNHPKEQPFFSEFFIIYTSFGCICILLDYNIIPYTMLEIFFCCIVVLLLGGEGGGTKSFLFVYLRKEIANDPPKKRSQVVAIPTINRIYMGEQQHQKKKVAKNKKKIPILSMYSSLTFIRF